jgi:ribonucleoside-diphosphate reductase alpha chain
MMAAAQPFLSGAISKTVNVPGETAVEEVERLFYEAWRLGLKSITIYRDGCKAAQPLSGGGAPKQKDGKAQAQEAPREAKEEKLPRLRRRRLPKKRQGFTQEAQIGGQKVYVRTGEYDDGTLGEIFIDMHKEGASLRSMLNCFAIAVSLGLQHGVPLDRFVDTFTFTRFEPQGPVDHPNIRFSSSVIDYLFRLLGLEYLGRTDFVQVKPEELAAQSAADAPKCAIPEQAAPAAAAREGRALSARDQQYGGLMGDAPFCDICGHITVRNGACYRCENCGHSLGCS